VMIGISSSKYYSWIDRHDQPNNHNGFIPKKHWILDFLFYRRQRRYTYSQVVRVTVMNLSKCFYPSGFI